MHVLINYIRSCFCRHDWELIFDTEVEISSPYNITVQEYGVKTYRCKKCGYSRKYKSN